MPTARRSSSRKQSKARVRAGLENDALALEAIKRKSFDLILFNGHADARNGWLRSYENVQRKRLQSAHHYTDCEYQDAERCFAAGCDKFIGKRFERTVLLQTVNSCMNKNPPPDKNFFDNDDDDEATRAIVKGFEAKLSERMTLLNQALQSQDWASLKFVAHQLRSARMFGYPALGELAGTLENAIDRGEHEKFQPLVEEKRLIKRIPCIKMTRTSVINGLARTLNFRNFRSLRMINA